MGNDIVCFVKASLQSKLDTSILPQGKTWDDVDMSFIAVADGQHKVLAPHEMLGTYGDEVIVVVSLQCDACWSGVSRPT